MKKKYFFGWTNIKWVIKELAAMYSGSSSYFSKKRIESGVAFIALQWAFIYYFLEHHNTMTPSDVLIILAPQLAICGYMINSIQKEKTNDIPETKENS